MLLAPAPAFATTDFAAQTDRPCAYCHVTIGGELTAEGAAFEAAGFVLPEEGDGTTPGGTGDGGATTGGATGTTSAGNGPTSSGTGDGGADDAAGMAGGPFIQLPDWLHDLLVWAHLAAMTTWLGAIIFVHVVQTPRVAGQGIPRGYLRLAWPAIGTLGLSGVLLTLNIIPSLATLTEGRWGWLLLAKIALYVVLVSVAAMATFVVSPRLRRLAEGAPTSAVDHESHRAAGRVTVEYDGRVYDVTESRLWKGGRHARRHDAYQDLTAALGGAPHGPEVFEAFQALAGQDTVMPRPVRAFVLLAYGNLSLVLAVLLVVALW
ncbi:MAG: CopD family protein [Actinobacteria bacterium]|nr:CopD family protein [Actinomycetota bacterium]